MSFQYINCLANAFRKRQTHQSRILYDRKTFICNKSNAYRISQIFCDQEKIVHDFCRIFEHNMVHFLKYIMLSTANDLIRMVYRSMTKRFYIGNFPFYLKFTDNLFKTLTSFLPPWSDQLVDKNS